jgi:hypothetical protein
MNLMSYRTIPVALLLGLAVAAAPAVAAAQSGSTQTAPPAGQPQGGQTSTGQPPAGQTGQPTTGQTGQQTGGQTGQQGTGQTAAPPPGQAGAQGQAAAAPGGGRDCMDQSYDWSMTGPDEWVRAKDTSSVTVPGEVRCVWSPDGTTILVAFIQKVHRPANPRALLNQSVAALQKSLGATAQEQGVRDVGGMRAMWMIVAGNGTGAALSKDGTMPTSQHWVAIPRANNDILILLLTAPTAKFPDQDQILQTALGTLKVGGTQTPEQKAAK